MASKSTPRSILLVGGGQGIGLETTKYLLEKTPSAVKLVVFGLHAAEELKNTLATARADRLTVLLGDVTSATDRKKAVQTCLDVAGGIDTMVYFAGVMTPIQRIDDMDLAEVRRSYEVNVFGAMEMVMNPEKINRYKKKEKRREENTAMAKRSSSANLSSLTSATRSVSPASSSSPPPAISTSSTEVGRHIALPKPP